MVERKITASTISELKLFENELHDLWINVDDFKADEGKKITLILHKDPPTWKECGKLEIACVENLKIFDDQKIGYYDLETFSYDPALGKLKIVCFTPLLVELELSSLALNAIILTD